MTSIPPRSLPPATTPSGGPHVRPIPVEVLLERLLDPTLREETLHDLCKGKDLYEDLAISLWHSPCVVSVLLHEVVSIYRDLSPPKVSPSASVRVCNALALLQVVASHPQTRVPLLHAQIPLYLCPILNTAGSTRAIEHLRLTTLGVMGALVKVELLLNVLQLSKMQFAWVNDTSIMSFLLQAEIIPLCLRIMDISDELSQTVATFIVQKILQADIGLQYICAAADRFFALCSVLSRMTTSRTRLPSARLLRNIIRCYLCLSEHPRACEALQHILPISLRDGTFNDFVSDDRIAMTWLKQLVLNVTRRNRTATYQAKGF